MLIPKYAKSVSPSVIRELSETPIPWGPCGYVTYKRTYSRIMPAGRGEEWIDTIERGCKGLLDIGAIYTQEEIDRYAYYWHQLKGCPAGRPIWQLGTKTVERLGGDSLMNCWHVAVDDPIDPFTFTFNQLMLGGGVGFNIQPEYVYALPRVKYAVKISRVDDYDCDYIVTDNREGWVELLRRVLQAYFFTGHDLRYDTRCIRDKGRLIAGFGGVASGPEELVIGIQLISEILTRAVGRKLRPVECMDIMNIIGMVVVAGNVRRSAEIAIGSPDDLEFLGAKDWSVRTVPKWRQMSNNTVATSDVLLLPETYWKGYTPGNGETLGLINLDLCRSHGRLIDGPDYRPDPGVIGCNPCGEITQESHEPCDLMEHFLPNIADVHEFGEVAKLNYRAAKAMVNMKFWHPKTNEVAQRNNRIGLSVTGYLQAPHFHDPEILDAVYCLVEEEDRKISREMKSSRSNKLTTVKPSGTLSLLAGVTPGVHAGFSPFYIRRITFAANDPILEAARRNGYNMEPKINIDGSRSLDTIVVDFPCKTPKGTPIANDLSAVQQLENQMFLQTHWSDNAVSATCYFRPNELPEIHNWLREHYPHGVKTTSFGLHEEHGFRQAPYEAITEEQYLDLVARVKPITNVVDFEQRDMIYSMECNSGGCPVR